MRRQLGARPTLRSHFWQSLANYAQQFFGLAIGVVLARLLHPEDFGVFAYASSLLVLAVLPANWSLGQDVLTASTNRRHVYREALAFAWKIVWIKALIITGLFSWFLWRREFPLAFTIALCGYPMAAQDLVGLMRICLEGEGNFKVNLYSALLTIGFSLTLGIPLALLGLGVYALALPAPVIWIAQLILYKKISGLSVWAVPMRSPLTTTISRGFVLWLSSAAEQALSRVDKIFLGHFGSTEALGNYNRAFNYAPLSHLVLNSLVANPTVSALGRCANNTARFRLIARSGAIVVGGSLLNFMVWWFFADPLVPWIFGSQWTEAIPLFRAFASLSFAYAVFYLPTTFLLNQRRYAVLAIVRLVGLCLMIGLLLLPENRGDAVRMAYAVQLSFLIMAAALSVAALWKK